MLKEENSKWKASFLPNACHFQTTSKLTTTRGKECHSSFKKEILQSAAMQMDPGGTILTWWTWHRQTDIAWFKLARESESGGFNVIVRCWGKQEDRQDIGTESISLHRFNKLKRLSCKAITGAHSNVSFYLSVAKRTDVKCSRHKNERQEACEVINILISFRHATVCLCIPTAHFTPYLQMISADP